MGVAVVTVAAGGLPVIDVTATKPGLGLPVTEAANGLGIRVTKVSLAVGGVPVTYVATTLQREGESGRISGSGTGTVAGEARGADPAEKRPLLPDGDQRHDAAARARRREILHQQASIQGGYAATWPDGSRK